VLVFWMLDVLSSLKNLSYKKHVYMLKSQDGAFDKLKKELLKYSLLPKECVFIDDHLPNIEQAKKAGFHTIHYEEFPKIENFEKDLMKILERGN